ncbi:MAG: YihY/virulence factor BrkB family protein [Solirubrobacterales bacterium]|nr:YihY/virulence factor BrkB family protein [Solirubrobacterales bacterium]
MDLLRPVRAFDRFQLAHKPLAVPMAVIRKFGNDQAGQLAALISYYAFFSIFPLLLVFTTILGFVLQGNNSIYDDVKNSVLGHFPGIDLRTHELSGNVTALVLGLLTSIWAGLGVTNAAQNAFNRVWAVPFKDRPDFIHSRLRGLLLLTCLGVIFVLSAVATGIVTTVFSGLLVRIGGYAVTLAVNFGLYVAAFRFLTATVVSTRSMWLGAALAAVFLTIMQFVGSIYVKHVVTHASNTYGTFATVIGLLVWLHLIAQMTLYSAEVNVVFVRKLWPRSLLGPPAEPADQETLRALAKVEERHEHEQVDVRFSEGDPAEDDADKPAAQPAGEPKR